MEKDKLPEDEEISTEELEQVSGGIGIINQNLNVIKLNTAIKIDSVSTEFLKIDSFGKI